MRLIERARRQRRRRRGARQLRRLRRRARARRRLGPERPPVVILCGGRGTRLQEHTQEIPKPLVEIGGMPIVWHVIRAVRRAGLRALPAGDRLQGRADRALRRRSSVAGGRRACAAWTPASRRRPAGGSSLLAPLLAGEERFCATYADGLADIDLAALLAFHAATARSRHDGRAPRAAVRRHRARRRRPRDAASARSRAPSTGSTAASSASSPARSTTSSADSVLERAPLERLAREGELRAHRHEGFWECMDTYKDAVALNDLWARAALRGGRALRRVMQVSRPRPEQRHAARGCPAGAARPRRTSGRPRSAARAARGRPAGCRAGRPR